MDEKETKLIDMVLTHEGGYANDPADSGGETYRGISRNYFPTWGGWTKVDKAKPLKTGQIIDDPSLEDSVRSFYDKYFYAPMKIGGIDYLMTAGHVFCHGVNAGPVTSIKLLQKAINAVCGASLKVDGNMGSATLSYANGEKKVEIAEKLINLRIEYYENLARTKPSQKKFLNGWINRVESTTEFCS